MSLPFSRLWKKQSNPRVTHGVVVTLSKSDIKYMYAKSLGKNDLRDAEVFLHTQPLGSPHPDYVEIRYKAI